MSRVVIITGASRGFGKELLIAFLKKNYKCVACSRNIDDLLLVRDEIIDGFGEKNASDNLMIQKTDVSKENECQHLVEQVVKKFGRVDVLVNNAGVHGDIGPLESCDIDKWRLATEINLFGTVYMMRSVLPIMKKQKRGKIINISGGGATGPRPNFSAYAVSKVAIVRLTETISQEWEKYNIDINAVAPGAMNTRLCDDIISAGVNAGKEYDEAVNRKKNGGDTFDAAIQLCLFLSDELSDGISGRILSAKWDKWSELPSYVDVLKNSDIYTIRRIVARDRGYDWDV